jgi:hypothetical protein
LQKKKRKGKKRKGKKKGEEKKKKKKEKGCQVDSEINLETSLFFIRNFF